MIKIIGWATTKYGDGQVVKIGEYYEFDEIRIIPEMWKKGVIITFSEQEVENGVTKS